MLTAWNSTVHIIRVNRNFYNDGQSKAYQHIIHECVTSAQYTSWQPICIAVFFDLFIDEFRQLAKSDAPTQGLFYFKWTETSFSCTTYTLTDTGVCVAL